VKEKANNGNTGAIGSLSHINTHSVLNHEENMGESETSVYLAPGRNCLKIFNAEKGRQKAFESKC
jgi:hypothetical protein